MKMSRALAVTHVAAAALLFLSTTTMANDGAWYKFCLDVYVIVNPGDPASPVASVDTLWLKLRPMGVSRDTRKSPVPKSKFKNGVATYGQGEALPDQNMIGDMISGMIGGMNEIVKECKVWFQGARIHFVDPTQAKAGAHALSEWLVGTNEQGMPSLDPAKKVDGTSFLPAFAQFARSAVPSSNCLQMMLVPMTYTGGEAGKAGRPGDYSYVDLEDAVTRSYGGITPAHEVLHNFGLDHSTPTPARPDPVTGAIDVMAEGKDVQGPGQILSPFILKKDCDTLCAQVAARYIGKAPNGLVKPVKEVPPRDYLVVPHSPEPPAQCPPSAAVEDGTKPKRPVADDLKVPSASTTLKEFSTMAAAWREALPAAPQNCCDANTLAENLKYVREMLARLQKARDAMDPLLHAAMTELDQTETVTRLNALRQAIDVLKKEIAARRDQLMKAQSRTKVAGKVPCDHTISMIPGEPLFPSDASERGYAMKFAYSDPEICVATIYYVGTRAEGEEGEPLVDFKVPIAIPEVPIARGGQDGVIPDCPRMAAAPAAPLALQEHFTGSEPVTARPSETSQNAIPENEMAKALVTPPPEDAEDLPKTTEIDELPQPEVTPAPDEADLGLVKANETVVRLVFEGAPTGEAVSQGVVKLLDSVPEVPLRNMVREEGLTADENYMAVSEGSALDPANGINIALNEKAEPHVVPTEEKGDIPAAIAILKRPQSKYVQLTLVGKPQSAGALLGLPGNLVPERARVCVNRSFRIGDRPVYVVSLPSNLVERFTKKAESAGYSFAEPDPCRQKEGVNDPLFGGKGLWGQAFDNQWALKRIGFDGTRIPGWPPPASALDTATVAVIDTGLDWYHPDFSPDSLWRNEAETPGNGIDDDRDGYVDDDIDWNFVDDNRLPWDEDGHGTFTAGVIGATINNGLGIAGIDPAARVMVLKALDAFGHGHASMVAEAISYAADHGASVINLSLGGPGLTRVEQLAVDYAQSKGALVVVAAGNAAQEVSNYGPAGLKGVITVAATDRADRRAGFSNWGPLVDIAAPGIDVLSLRARHTDLLSLIPGVKYETGNGIVGSEKAYFRASGTSFAAPLVTGTIAYLRSLRPDLDAASIRRMVLNSAKDIETPGIDNYTGYGLLDAAAAIAADPAYFIEARIDRVDVFRRNGKVALRLTGTADANAFRQATVMIGQGVTPTKWLRIDRPITRPVVGGTLIDLPASMFGDAKDWTLRLVTEHGSGSKREARFHLVLG